MKTRLINQIITSVDDNDNVFIIKTDKFEFTVKKDTIKEINPTIQYPHIIFDSFIDDGGGYAIYYRMVQYSNSKQDMEAFVYFPNINCSFISTRVLHAKKLINWCVDYTGISFNPFDKTDDYLHYIVLKLRNIRVLNIQNLEIIRSQYCIKLHKKNKMLSLTDINKLYCVDVTAYGYVFSSVGIRYELRTGKDF